MTSFCTLGLALCRFHRVDELRNSFSIAEEILHGLWDIHRVDSVKTRKKLGDMFQELEGNDISVEGVRVLKILAPCFVNDSHDEVLAGIIGRLVEMTVISLCFMSSLCLMDFCSPC